MPNRLFIASYEDIQEWGAKSDRLFNTIEKEDKIFFIQGDEPLGTAKEKMIQKLKKVSNVRISDTEGQNSAIVGKALLTEFLKKEEKEIYTVYIIGSSLKCLYEDKADFEEYAENVFYNHNFQVKRLKKDDGQDSMQMFMDALMGSDGADNIHTEASERKPQKKNTSLKAEKERKNKKDQTQGSVSIETQRASIEKEIFGAAFESKDYEETYTELQNARAKYIYELQKRTNRHIRQKLFRKKETITLTDHALYDFITLIMSSDDAEMFNESWSSQHNDIKFEMTEELFQSILPEIAFFNRICELVYEKDYWED